MQDGAARAEVKAADYLEDLAKLVLEVGYAKRQIFNVDETAICWKKTPSRVFIARDEVSMLGSEIQGTG